VPELPEVETTLRGIRPYLQGRRVERLAVREPRLRLPIPAELPSVLTGRPILGLSRRAKYLLIELEGGTLILHLGMSGSLRVLPADSPPAKHDHVDLILSDGRCLRLRDPRRFGLLVWTTDPPALAEGRHPLLKDLGPEPLGDSFDGDYLHRESRGRRVAVKPFLMDGRVVVGVGNIYANEALFRAGIHPARPCHRIGVGRYQRLAETVRAVLGAAIAQGGTSLRDFVQEDGNPGYFAQSLQVYGRAGEPCPGCGAPLRQRRIGQRSSFYCPRCQR
jgi:formamidopyrimidine-DNA glycosylase